MLGLQAHNSSGDCDELLSRSIEAVRQYHGNTLEAPVYWYQIEPEEGKFDFSAVERLILKTREAGLRLIILWFGFSKNADLTYMPAWAKADPARFRLAVTSDGGRVPMMSPHCQETVEADRRAFVKLMTAIRAFDESVRTVIAVQVENEVGLYHTDRCYSKCAQAEFDMGVPDELVGVEIDDSGATGGGNSWFDRFGRYANEAFSAWAFARAIERIASGGREAYPDIPLYMNTMIGEIRQEVAGQSYSSGSPVGRVLDIWKIGAKSIALFAPDIYLSAKSDFLRVCKAHSRSDNPLFIPETGTSGDGFAIDFIHAAADYAAIGICGFGAESTLQQGGKIGDSQRKVAESMDIIRAMSPILLQKGGTDSVFCVTQEEFQNYAYVKRKEYHLTFNFTDKNEKGRTIGGSLRSGAISADEAPASAKRGRAIVYEASPFEYYMSGAGIVARFLRRTDPRDPRPMRNMFTRAATEMTAITVEEGHFDENGGWVCEFARRGDELDMGVFLYPGTVLRVVLNPAALAEIDW